MLMVLLAMGIFSFWLNRRQDKRSVYTIGICLWLTATGFGIFTPELIGNTGLYLLLLLWGTVSLEECRSLQKAAVVVETAGAMEETAVPKRVAVSETVVVPEGTTVSEKAGVMEKTDAPEKKQPKKVQYIENPLPLPKKHIKREMDYSLKEMQDEDDFDLDIGDEDDFDY